MRSRPELVTWPEVIWGQNFYTVPVPVWCPVPVCRPTRGSALLSVCVCRVSVLCSWPGSAVRQCHAARSSAAGAAGHGRRCLQSGRYYTLSVSRRPPAHTPPDILSEAELLLSCPVRRAPGEQPGIWPPAPLLPTTVPVPHWLWTK